MNLINFFQRIFFGQPIKGEPINTQYGSPASTHTTTPAMSNFNEWARQLFGVG